MANKITERDLQDALMMALEGIELNLDDGRDVTIESTRSFRDAGLLSSNKGIVIELSNGATFQLTLVKDERSEEQDEDEDDEDEDDEDEDDEGDDMPRRRDREDFHADG